MSRRQLNGELKPLSVPDRLPPSIESPGSRWPPSGTLSPGFSGFRSPPPDSELHARRFGSISSPGTLDESIPPWQHRGSYDHSIYSDSEVVMTDSGIRELNINDPSPAGSDEYQSVNKAGQKRRASSPPSDITREDGATGIGHAQLYHRRSAQKLMGRNSPVVSRFQQANPGSLSSVSSLGQRNASFASSYTFSGASSMTSYNGDQRPSPNALSPSTEAEVGSLSPYSATRSLDPSPRGSVSRPLQRGLSDLEHLQLRKLSTDSSLHSRQNSVTSRVGGAYTCDCCPKKPKKFDTEEQLRLVFSHFLVPVTTADNSQVSMKWKSSILASTARIGSKTRTRPRGIKILFICDGIPGHVQPLPASKPHFILLPHIQAQMTCVVIVVRTSQIRRTGRTVPTT
jgi:hypothetical protein